MKNTQAEMRIADIRIIQSCQQLSCLPGIQNKDGQCRRVEERKTYNKAVFVVDHRPSIPVDAEACRDRSLPLQDMHAHCISAMSALLKYSFQCLNISTTF